MTNQNQNNKTHIKNNNNKVDKIEVDIPRKLEKEVQQYNRNLLEKNEDHSRSVGINAKTSKMLPEKIHSVQVGIGGNTLTVAGHCLLSVLETNAAYTAGSGSQNTFMLKRMFVHPGSVPSRRLSSFATLYSKYKFKKFDLRYEGEVNATVNGAFMVAYTKDYTPLEPKPGVSTRSWMSEMQGVREMKVWDSGLLGTLNKVGDLPSYFISKSIIEPETCLQAQILFAGVGLSPSQYYGDLYLEYEVEFSMPLVPPTNFNNQLQYTAAGHQTLGNALQWQTLSADQIDYWSSRQGIYFCTMAQSSWNGFSVCKDYASRNYYGTSFIMTIVAAIDTVVGPNYSNVTFSVFADIAAATLGERAILELTNDYYTVGDLNFEGTLIASVSPSSVTITDPITVKGPVYPLPNRSGGGLCGIGISVGPGVFAGEPDLAPSIGFDKGRMVCGNPTRR